MPDPSDIRATNKIAVALERGVVDRSWYLIVAGGGDEPSSRVIVLDDPAELVFGRQADCDVILDRDGVSRRHAELTRHGSRITILDLGSTNGTVVNGTRVIGSRRLAMGDVIAIGTATVVLATTTAARDRRHVATVTELEDRLEAEVERASRYRRTLGLVMLRLTPGAGIALEDDVGALVKSLRRTDLLAEYSPDELAVLMPEATRTAMAAVISRARAAPSGLAVTAGTALFPDDGTHAGELIAIARDRLRGVTQPAAGHAPPAVVVDPKMQLVMTMVDRVAPSGITVLILGETGVGKEIVAETIHRRGPRARGPFVRLNCAALTETLVESELFGHVKGAFTNAVADKPGQFELAAGGTVFLDEIGELPLEAQAKLLRVIEHRRVIRVGGVLEQPVDVRIVCATHRDLEAEVKRGRFRSDLYFRIGAFVIPVPPLRDRRSEIVPLAERFLGELSPQRPPCIAPEAIKLLEGYDWPGNVRELRNAIERALVLAGDRIEPGHLPERVLTAGGVIASTGDIRQRVANVERQTVIDALAAADGKQATAARALGISRFALMRLMDKHGLKKR